MFYPDSCIEDRERSVSAINRVLESNLRNAIHYDPQQVSPYPHMRLAVLTCMDTRISLAALGLKVGDAHLIRNAGGIATDDAIRSLVVSHYLLGTNEIMVINHTDCGLMKTSEDELHDKIAKEAGKAPSSEVRFHVFQDADSNVRKQLERLTSHSWLSGRVKIRGFVFDVDSGRLHEVQR
jgi:carbonic anhydrase